MTDKEDAGHQTPDAGPEKTEDDTGRQTPLRETATAGQAPDDSLPAIVL